METTNQTTKSPDSAPSVGSAPSVDEFDALYRDSADDLFSYLTYLVGDRSLAEELTASAFERALRRRKSFVSGRANLRGWLFRIARNAAIDELRTSGRHSALELEGEVPGSDATPDSLVVDRLLVATAMQRLQPAERELVALKFFAGLDNADIAQTLRISKTNVATRLSRAIAHLRAEIGEPNAL
jgi:RNA polymerase sigma-70 factor (ECF subfamily)